MNLRPRGSMALALVAAIATGCGSGAPATSADRSASPAPVASGTPAADLVTRAALSIHLDRLASIARDNGGTRATGTGGDAATAAYARSVLTDLGYTVAEDAFDTPIFLDPGGSSLTILGEGGRSFEYGRDLRPLVFAPSRTAEGPVVALGWDANATEADGPGCAAGDFAAVPRGAIVLTRPGPCLRRTVVMNAQDAGAAAIVTAYPWYGPDEVRPSTLVDPGGITVPAVATTGEVGSALADAATAGLRVRVATTGTVERRTVRSILAEITGSDPGRVVMLGAHLDSAMQGPGIDDNGTGVAALLTIAEALAGSRPVATIRFAFWAAEETGLQGSGRYVAHLDPMERSRIVAYLNADMLGSPNGIRGVYDEPKAATGSDRIRDLFAADLDAAGLAWEGQDLAQSSDHRLFAEAGIPTGGLFSGALDVITPEQAERFGRTAGGVADACYHLACDDRSNVDEQLLGELANSLARVTLALALEPS